MREKAAPPPILALVLVTAMSPLALNIFLPSMPSMARDFGVETPDIQPALSLYFLGVAVGQLIYGPLSDRYGRRPVLLAGATVFALTNVYLIFTGGVLGLILGRTAQAFGGCSGMVLTRAIVRDVYDTDQSASAMGYITTAMVVAPALAPALGAYLDVTLGWRSSFMVLAIYAAFAVPAIIFWIGETNRHPLDAISLETIIHNYAWLLRAPVFIAYMLTVTFGAASFFSFVAGAPHAVIDFMGKTPVDYAIYFIGAALAYMAGSFLAGRYAVRIGLHRMLKWGLVLMTIGSIAVLGQLFYGPSLMALFLPVGFASFGSGFVNPAATAGALSVRPQIAGAASGLLGFAPLLLGAVFSEIIGRSFAFGIAPFLIIYAGASTTAALFGLIAIHLEKRLSNISSPAQ